MPQNVTKYRSHGTTLNRNKQNSGRQKTARSKEIIELSRNILENNSRLTRICIEKYGKHVEWKFAEVVTISICQNSCSANVQQVYRRTPMKRCDFYKIGLLFFCTHTTWVFSCIFVAYLQNTSFEEHLLKTASDFVTL